MTSAARFLALLLLTLAASGAFARAAELPEPPRAVVEVRRGTGAGGVAKAFPDAAAAIASVTDASPEKTYVVKLAPGLHAAPPLGLAMKPFVDLEGSGPDATVIEGAVAAGTPLWLPPLTPDQPAVVRVAHDSRLRGLTVRNTSRDGGIAVYFPMTANAGAEDVVAEALGAMTPGLPLDYHAIRVQGPGGDVSLDRVTARYRMEVPPGGQLIGDNVAIGVFGGGKLLVTNSRAVAENGWWNVGITCERGSECVVRDSVIEVSGQAQGAYAFSAQAARGEVRDTTMTVNCPSDNTWGCAAVLACMRGSAVDIRASDLRVIPGERTARMVMLACSGTISGSRLAGPDNYGDWKLVDCTDGDGRPIPNSP